MEKLKTYKISQIDMLRIRNLEKKIIFKYKKTYNANDDSINNIFMNLEKMFNSERYEFYWPNYEINFDPEEYVNHMKKFKIKSFSDFILANIQTCSKMDLENKRSFYFYQFLDKFFNWSKVDKFYGIRLGGLHDCFYETINEIERSHNLYKYFTFLSFFRKGYIIKVNEKFENTFKKNIFKHKLI